jgi:predicted Zn-dependent protease
VCRDAGPRGRHGQTGQPGQGVNFYSQEKEIALGRQLAQQFRQKTTLVDSVSVNDYVRRVGANLAAQFPGGWTYQIEIIKDDPGGATHEPVAFPAGFLFVPADLIAAARNEAEFAGMLAHAMAHVAARHGTKSATKTQLMALQYLPDNGAGEAEIRQLPAGAYRASNEFSGVQAEVNMPVAAHPSPTLFKK